MYSFYSYLLILFLGFLPAQVDGILRGNYGLLDIVAGLHWLQQNIAAFGGQAANVTLIGHGHGAALAHILALSPMAKGKHNKLRKNNNVKNYYF